MAQPYLSAQEILKRTFINNTGSLKVTSEPYSIQDYLNAVFDSNSNSLRVYSEQAAESSSSSIGSVGNIIAGEGISIVNDIISIDTTVSEIGSFLVRTEDGVGWGIPSGSLPVVTSQDNDKVLTVINGAWAKAFPTTELPIVTVADNDKILTVVSGAWAKADAPSSGTTYTAGNGIDITNDTISINSASATTGQILSKGETGTTWVASPVSATTANVQTALSIDTGAGSLAKVLSEKGTFVDLPVNTDTTYTAGNGIDITNEVISLDVTGATTGQVLKKTELGIGWANDETGTAELPTVTVADNDKILTVVAGVWTKAAPGSPYAIESLHALPEAIVGNLGKTVFYTGPTENGLYKNSFYVLEEVGVEPEITYEWIAYGVANSSISIKQAILTLPPEDPPNPVLIDVLGNIQDIDDENNADNVIETHYRIDFSGYILSMENYESEEAALTDRYYGKMSYNSDNNITNIFMTVEEYTVMSSFTAGKNILKINYLENPEVSIGNTVSDGASTLPVVTVADNGKVLTVVNGNWEKADVPNGVTTVSVQTALSIDPVDGLEEKILSQKGTFVDLPAGGASIFQQDITPLTGTPVSVSAGGVYSWTISAASVVNKGTWSGSGLEYAIMMITVESGGSLTGGAGITLVDALQSGFNYCILRSVDGVVKIFRSPE